MSLRPINKVPPLIPNRCFSVLPVLLLLSPAFSPAQTQKADSTASAKVPGDTTRSTQGGGIDTLVVYSARDSIIYSMSTRYMYLYGKSETQYRTLGLKSERMDVNWDTSALNAEGVPDTVKSDSTIGKPVMKDGGEEYRGDKVSYNFKSKKGRITVGKTEIENGFYRGEQIKKVESNVLFVEDGIYTTCDAPHPHFYFYSPKMKILVHDLVVAEPVYFYIADVPLFALPFGVFPAHGGRSSGIIAPAYGEDNRYGKYLSHGGYYFAVSDYLDIATTFDLYSRGGWLNRSNLQYALRYNFTGALNASISSLHEGEVGDPQRTEKRDYNVNLSHHQQITPSPEPSNLDVNFTFASGSFYRNFSADLNSILLQNVISNATYSKIWEKSNRSLTLNISRDQVLTTGELQEGLPSISFSQGTVFPFRKKTKSRGLTNEGESDAGFLEMLGIGYSANASNSLAKLSWSVDSIKSVANGIVAVGPIKDFQTSNSQNINQNIVLSISPKLGPFTVSPSFSFSDQRRFTQSETPDRNSADSSLIFRSDRSKATAGLLSTGLATSTRFFGIFQPQIFGVTSVRHTVSPTLSLTYNKQVYGENIPKYSMVGGLSLGNNFEMKYQKADTGAEEKIQLMNIGGFVSYDFARDSLNLSEISLNYRTDIGQLLDISGGATYNLYKYDPAANARVNRFLISETGKIADLTNFSVSLSTSFRGEKKVKPSTASVPQSVQDEQARASGSTGLVPAQKKIYQSIYDKEDADFSIPWNVSIGYNFNQSQPTPSVLFRTSSLNMALSFNLTEKWQISTRGTYDFVTDQHFVPSVDITRDLHCWTMSFTWYPMGYQEGYRLELKVKAPQLQDLKVTKQNSQSGYARY